MKISRYIMSIAVALTLGAVFFPQIGLADIDVEFAVSTSGGCPVLEVISDSSQGPSESDPACIAVTKTSFPAMKFELKGASQPGGHGCMQTGIRITQVLYGALDLAKNHSVDRPARKCGIVSV